jgi:hypothetical protein
MHMDQFNFPPSPGCRYAHMRVCVYAEASTCACEHESMEAWKHERMGAYDNANSIAERY